MIMYVCISTKKKCLSTSMLNVDEPPSIWPHAVSSTSPAKKRFRAAWRPISGPGINQQPHQGQRAAT